nr:ATP-binding protein [Denitromonas sp.]
RDLVGDLLEGERLAAGASALAPETVDLRRLAAEAAAEARATPQVDASIGPVRADPARLRLLLRNLSANARRHAADAPQPPVLFLRRAGGELELGLRDFGPGVPQEALARLAEPFYRPDGARTRASGGVGLGLHLCQQMATAVLGGTLRLLDTDTGHGAHFCLTLPVVAPDRLQPAAG